MALLPILRYPHPNLALVAQEVAVVDDSIRNLVSDMFETMYAANGIGLAATQVDRHLRVVVIDVSEERERPLVLINPRITQLGDEKEKGKEGCLSVPEIYDTVERAQSLSVEALNEKGEKFIVLLNHFGKHMISKLAHRKVATCSCKRPGNVSGLLRFPSLRKHAPKIV